MEDDNLVEMFREWIFKIANIQHSIPYYKRILSRHSQYLNLITAYKDLLMIDYSLKYYKEYCVDFRGRIYVKNTMFNYQASKIIRSKVDLPILSIFINPAILAHMLIKLINNIYNKNERVIIEYITNDDFKIDINELKYFKRSRLPKGMFADLSNDERLLLLKYLSQLRLILFF
jgi:hypothetical protein